GAHRHLDVLTPARNARARVAELADALDLGSSEETRGGSTPPSRTRLRLQASIKTGLLRCLGRSSLDVSNDTTRSSLPSAPCIPGFVEASLVEPLTAAPRFARRCVPAFLEASRQRLSWRLWIVTGDTTFTVTHDWHL